MTHWEIVNNIIFPDLPYTHSIFDLSAKRVQITSCRWGWQLNYVYQTLDLLAKISTLNVYLNLNYTGKLLVRSFSYL